MEIKTQVGEKMDLSIMKPNLTWLIYQTHLILEIDPQFGEMFFATLATCKNGFFFHLTVSSSEKNFAKTRDDFFPFFDVFFFRPHIFPVFNIFNFLDTFPIFIEIPLLRFRPSNENDNFMHIIITIDAASLV